MTDRLSSKSFNCVVVRLIARPLGQNHACIAKFGPAVESCFENAAYAYPAKHFQNLSSSAFMMIYFAFIFPRRKQILAFKRTEICFNFHEKTTGTAGGFIDQRKPPAEPVVLKSFSYE